MKIGPTLYDPKTKKHGKPAVPPPAAPVASTPPAAPPAEPPAAPPAAPPAGSLPRRRRTRSDAAAGG